MMQAAGKVSDAIALAETRWRAIHPFDLERSQWEALFNSYAVGDVLEAIKLSRVVRSQRPEIRYQLFMEKLNALAEQAEFSRIFQEEN